MSGNKHASGGVSGKGKDKESYLLYVLQSVLKES